MFLFFPENVVELVYLIDDGDALTSIGKFSRFDYPYVFYFFGSIFGDSSVFLDKVLVLGV